MSDDKVNELRIWQDLVSSDGWHKLLEHYKAIWVEKLGDHIAACANDNDDTAALNKLRQVVAAKRAVDQMLAFPSERLRLLRPAPEPEGPTSMRRGGV